MSTTSNATWQRVYHTTLFRFSREGREQILHAFRESPDVKSATCIYDEQQHHFEISCLTADSEDAEKVLEQVIAGFIQDEDNNNNEFADYKRKATKFPHAIIDEGDNFDDDISEPPEANFKDDDLIDLSTEAEKTSWMPSFPSLQLERCYPQTLLDAIGHATGCILTLDMTNRRILIKPSHASADVNSVKRRLANVEEISTKEVPALHSLKTSKPQELYMQLHKLNEKAEKDAAFNEDGTLSRLLFPSDSSVFDVRKADSQGKILEKLMVLRPYKVEPFPDTPHPVKIKYQPLKAPAVKPVSSIFSQMKFRKLGPDAPQPPLKDEPEKPAEPPAQQAIVGPWLDSVVDSQPKKHVQVSHLEAVNDIERQKQAKAKARNQAARPQPTVNTQSVNSASRGFATAAQTPKPAEEPPVKPTQKPTNPNVFSTRTYGRSTAPVGKPWATPQSPAKPAWGSGPLPENRWPRPTGNSTPSGRDSFAAPRGRGRPGIKPQQRTGPAQSAASRQPAKPPAPRSVASSNPFAQLGGQHEGEDDSEDPQDDGDEIKESLAADDGDEIKESLAADDEPPTRLRVNRQRAPEPPPSPRNPLFGTVPDNHGSKANNTGNLANTGTTSTSDAATTDATSVDSADGAPPFAQMLKTIKADNMQLRLGSASFRKSLSTMHTALERARALQGCLHVKVQIGKVVMRQAASDVRKDITVKSFDEKLKQVPGMNTLDQTFTNAVTTSITDVDSLLNNLGIGDSTEPIHQSAYFELTCIRSDKSTTRIVVDTLDNGITAAAEPFGRSSESLLSTWYNHHPQRAWDSRLVLTNHTNYSLDNISGAADFIHSLSIRHNPDRLGPNVAGRNVEGLHLQQVRFYTTVRYLLVTGWDTKNDVYVEVKRVVDYHPINVFQANNANAVRGQFSATCPTEKKAIETQQLWFEITLGLVSPSPKLLQNEPHPEIADPAAPKPDVAEVDELDGKLGGLELYEKADWKPEEVLKGEQLLALHEVATKIVDRMDGVGARNKGFGAARELELKRMREKLAATPDQFW